jgi:putative endonuclease
MNKLRNISERLYFDSPRLHHSPSPFGLRRTSSLFHSRSKIANARLPGRRRMSAEALHQERKSPVNLNLPLVWISMYATEKADPYVLRIRSAKHPKPAEFYTGSTIDLRTRLRERNAGKSPYSRKFSPWELMFYAAFPERLLAEHFERYLKSGSGRAFAKRHFVESLKNLAPSSRI